MTRVGRSLDHEPSTPVAELGAAAIDDLLDRGDVASWAPLAAAVRKDAFGPLAETVLRLCDAHPMYGTSALWKEWIALLRRPSGRSLRELRRSRGLTQRDVAERLAIRQSDVSKIERRTDVRLSTLRGYVRALGGQIEVSARFADGEAIIET